MPVLLAQARLVLAVEQQVHGRTADIDRPMSIQAMAEDTLAVLASLGIGHAVVRKAVLAWVAYDKNGLHAEMFGGPDPGVPATLRRDLQSAFEQEYRALPPTRATGRPC